MNVEMATKATPKVYRVRGPRGVYVVAAKSKADAARLISDQATGRYTTHDLTNYGGITGNDEEIAIAMSMPGQVFWTGDDLARSHDPDRKWIAVGSGGQTLTGYARSFKVEFRPVVVEVAR